jgi:AcrR family transcriptional regulator
MNEGDPRVKRTRKLLEEAFVALLAEKSFQAISVQDIAERATVNRATFYAHFEDKYALMDQVIRDTFQEVLQQRLGEGAPLTRGNLHVLLVTVCDFLVQFHGHCAPAPADRDLEPLIEAKVQQEIYTFLVGWLRQAPHGEVFARASQETVATVLSWAVFGVGIEWSRGERTGPPDEWTRQVLTVIVDGVAQIVTVPPQLAPSRQDTGVLPVAPCV